MLTQKLKVAGFLLNIAEWDRHLEVVRQILNGIPSFEPYAAFRRLSGGEPARGIDPASIEDFLRDNGLSGDSASVQIIVSLFDTKFAGRLDFEDFLKLTLARDNPEARFDAAAQRDIEESSPGERLAEEVEYCLGRLLSKACEFVKRMKVDAESQSILGDRGLIGVIGGSPSHSLDFKTLKTFFESLRIVPRDSELIAILRIIDINDDGLIDKTELDYFGSLFSLKGSKAQGVTKLRQRAIKDREVNYFGEVTSGKDGRELGREAVRASRPGERFERATTEYREERGVGSSATNGKYQRSAKYERTTPGRINGTSGLTPVKRDEDKGRWNRTENYGEINRERYTPTRGGQNSHQVNYSKISYEETKFGNPNMRAFKETTQDRLNINTLEGSRYSRQDKNYAQTDRYQREINDLKILDQSRSRSRGLKQDPVTSRVRNISPSLQSSHSITKSSGVNLRSSIDYNRQSRTPVRASKDEGNIVYKREIYKTEIQSSPKKAEFSSSSRVGLGERSERIRVTPTRTTENEASQRKYGQQSSKDQTATTPGRTRRRDLTQSSASKPSTKGAQISPSKYAQSSFRREDINSAELVSDSQTGDLLPKSTNIQGLGEDQVQPIQTRYERTSVTKTSTESPSFRPE